MAAADPVFLQILWHDQCPEQIHPHQRRIVARQPFPGGIRPGNGLLVQPSRRADVLRTGLAPGGKPAKHRERHAGGRPVGHPDEPDAEVGRPLLHARPGDVAAGRLERKAAAHGGSGDPKGCYLPGGSALVDAGHARKGAGSDRGKRPVPGVAAPGAVHARRHWRFTAG